MDALSDDEVRDMDFSTIEYARDAFSIPSVFVRNVRLASGLYVGRRDLDEERKRVTRSKPRWLQLPI